MSEQTGHGLVTIFIERIDTLSKLNIECVMVMTINFTKHDWQKSNEPKHNISSFISMYIQMCSITSTAAAHFFNFFKPCLKDWMALSAKPLVEGW